MLSVGLTGNIASGKSIVESYFEKKGISVINADDVTHELIDKDRNIQQRFQEQKSEKSFFLTRTSSKNSKTSFILQ